VVKIEALASGSAEAPFEHGRVEVDGFAVID
jgi:hypothetical protein